MGPADINGHPRCLCWVPMGNPRRRSPDPTSAITTAAQRPLPMYSRPIHNVHRVATQFRQIPSVSTYPPPPRPFPNSSMNSNYAVGHNHLMSPSNGTMVVPQAQYNRGNVSVNRRRNQRIPIPWSMPGVIDRAVEIVWLNKFWDVNTRLTLRKNKESVW